MVRHKTRWLLVQWEGDEDVNNNNATATTSFPSKKEFSLLLRQTISSCFGIASDGAARDTQVRFCHATTRLILLRVPREFCGMVRAALTLLTHWEHKTTTTTATKPSSSKLRIMVSVLGVYGSARTAKLSIMSRIRSIYQPRIITLQQRQQQQQTADHDGDEDKDDDETTMAQECSQLERLLSTIQNLD